jgi:hypothetical protein
MQVKQLLDSRPCKTLVVVWELVKKEQKRNCKYKVASGLEYPSDFAKCTIWAV